MLQLIKSDSKFLYVKFKNLDPRFSEFAFLAMQHIPPNLKFLHSKSSFLLRLTQLVKNSFPPTLKPLPHHYSSSSHPQFPGFRAQKLFLRCPSSVLVHSSDSLSQILVFGSISSAIVVVTSAVVHPSAESTKPQIFATLTLKIVKLKI